MKPLINSFLVSLFLLTDATQAVRPVPTIPPPPVDQRIDTAVDSNCRGAKSKLAAALSDGSPNAWSSYVRFIMQCGDREKGLTQARIYTAGVLGIGSILYVMPDAYGSATWRKTARQIISRALPNARADRELVSLLYSLDHQLTAGVRPEDRKPNIDSVAPRKLVPSGASGVGSSRSGGDETEIWFVIDSHSLSDAEGVVRKHLRDLGWYFCPAERPNTPHDEIIVKYVGPSPTPDPHIPRKADLYVYASLRNEWDADILLYAQGASATRAVFLVTQVTMSPHCSMYKNYFGAVGAGLGSHVAAASTGPVSS